MTTESATDMGVGLALLFGVLAIGGAALTGINSYNYAIREAQGIETTGLLANSGIAFGVAIVALHVYDT